MKENIFSKAMPLFFAVMLVFSMVLPGMVYATETDGLHKSDQTNAEAALKDAVKKQSELQKEKPYLHKALRDLEGDEQTPVIVRFSENPIAVEQGKHLLEETEFSEANEVEVAQKVQAEQKEFKTQLANADIEADIGYSYQHVLNGMALKVPAKDVEKLLELDSVISVEPDEERVANGEPEKGDHKAEAAMNSSISHLGIDEIWEDGIDGEGIKVGVVDTGIDYDHPDLVDAYKGGKNFVEQDNDDYLNPRDDDDPYETSPIDRPDDMDPVDENGNTYETSHGTHVAGTIAAAGNNDFGINGVAPGVELYAYRVLGAYGTGMTSWVIAGIEEAVAQDMDVINLSLGGVNNESDTPDVDAVNNAMLAGVVTVVATGNAGPERGTVGSPGTAPFGISVGNSTNPETLQSAKVDMEAGDFSASSNISMMAWTFGKDPEEDIDGTYDVVSVSGFGEEKDYENVDAEGKFALVERGEIAFVDKIAAAKDAGAVGTLIYNAEDDENSPGPADVYLGDAFEFIPSFDMAHDDGAAFVDAIEANDGHGEVIFSAFETDRTDGDEMSETSSRGQANPDFDIKPDVTAPGSNIMSSVAAYQKDIPEATYDEAYERYSGTSMATPHVAGIAALLLEKNEDWTAFDVKVALSNTGKTLDLDSYDVFDQGAGRVEPTEAIDTPILATVDEEDDMGERGTLAFGYTFPSEDDSLTFTKDIDLTNQLDSVQDYEIDVEVTHQPDGDMENAEVTVDKSSIELDDTETIAVNLDLPKGESEDGDEILGYIHLNGEHSDVSLPFAASLAPEPEFGVKNMELESYHISPNGDGEADSTNVNFEFYEMQFFTLLYFWDVLDPNGGIDGEGTVGDIYQEVGLEEGPHSVEISNTILDPDDNSETKTISDGVYTIELGTLTYEGNEEDYDNTGPIFIVTEKPEVDIEETVSDDGLVSGTVDSKYVDFEEPLRSIYDLDYNPEDYLYGSYEIVSDNGDVVGEDEFDIDNDGTFSVDTAELRAGSYTMDVQVTDEAKNTTYEEVSFDVEAALNIGKLQPDEDKYVAAGDEVEISFSSETRGGDASFAVEFPNRDDAELNATGNMKETLPGEYKGTWTVPDNVRLDGATISASLSKDGETVSAESAGKLFIYPDKTDRIAGDLRYDTAVKTSQAGWNQADTVVLARGDEYADALAGVPLAYKLDAPILLTPTDELWEATADEIDRLDADNVVILGGDNAVGPEVESSLIDNGLDVRRIEGDDRFDTAALISDEVAPDGSSEVAVVNGMDFPDALSVASSAAQEGMPILLVKSDWMSDETANTIDTLGAEKAHVVGGPEVVSDEIANQLPGANRLSGHDRYDTNIDVLEHFDAANKHMYVATGTNYADALTGAVLAAKNDSGILLVHKKVPEATANYITDQGVEHLTTFGGEVAVDETVLDALDDLLK